MYLVINRGLPLACTCWDRGVGRGQPKEKGYIQLRCPKWPNSLLPRASALTLEPYVTGLHCPPPSSRK